MDFGTYLNWLVQHLQLTLEFGLFYRSTLLRHFVTDCVPGVGEVRKVAREGFEAVGEMRQGLGEVRQVVRESFDKAYSAVIVAARAHEELCKKTEQLKNNPDAVEKLKRAKICTRHLENMFQVYWE